MPPQLSGRGRTVPAQISAHEKTRSLSAPGLSHWCSLRRPVAAPSLYRTGCGLSNRLAAAPGHRLPPALAPEQRTRPDGGGRGVGALAFGSLPACGCDRGPPGSGVRPAAFAVYRKMKSCANVIMLRFMDNSRPFHGCDCNSLHGPVS